MWEGVAGDTQEELERGKGGNRNDTHTFYPCMTSSRNKDKYKNVKYLAATGLWVRGAVVMLLCYQSVWPPLSVPASSRGGTCVLIPLFGLLSQNNSSSNCWILTFCWSQPSWYPLLWLLEPHEIHSYSTEQLLNRFPTCLLVTWLLT